MKVKIISSPNSSTRNYISINEQLPNYPEFPKFPEIQTSIAKLNHKIPINLQSSTKHLEDLAIPKIQLPTDLQSIARGGGF